MNAHVNAYVAGMQKAVNKDCAIRIAVPLLFLILIFYVSTHAPWLKEQTSINSPAPKASQEVSLPREMPASKQTYKTGALEGHRANGLYADFIGYKGRIPVTIQVNFAEQLEALWKRKTSRRNSNPVVTQTKLAILANYAQYDPGLMSLAEYQANAARQVDSVYNNLDWQKLRRDRLRGDTRRLAVVKEAAKTIGGRSLVAYQETELFPYDATGKYNRDSLDFILRNAGRSYVESLPALHDSITSFGPCQFTQYALYDGPGGPRGASRINRYLPEQHRIPGSTMMLRGNDHVKACYLFGVDNLVALVSGLNRTQLRTFERVAPSRGLDIVQFVAIGHNKPAAGLTCAKRWLDAGAKKDNLWQYCQNGASKKYGQKTVSNFRALSPTLGS